MNLSRVETRSAVVGMTLGDGYMVKKVPTSMSFVHSPRQLAYATWKAGILEVLTGYPIKPYSYQTKLSNGKSYEQVRFMSRTHPLLQRIRYVAYPDAKKTITEKLLFYLTPLGLAIWYMDDGSINFIKRKGKITGRQIFLHTACPENEADLVRNYFLSTWGIDWKKFKIRQDSGFFSLRANANNAVEFFKLISQYVHPSMRYKIDLQYYSKDNGRLYTHTQKRVAELRANNLDFSVSPGSDEIVLSIPKYQQDLFESQGIDAHC